MTKIRDARLRAGWTQEELAERCAERGAPVTRVAISQLERGFSWQPRPRLRKVLAELLGLDVIADFQPDEQRKASA